MNRLEWALFTNTISFGLQLEKHFVEKLQFASKPRKYTGLLLCEVCILNHRQLLAKGFKWVSNNKKINLEG